MLQNVLGKCAGEAGPPERKTHGVRHDEGTVACAERDKIAVYVFPSIISFP